MFRSILNRGYRKINHTMKATEKYNRIRNEIKNGDIILFRGSSLLSRTIQWGDSIDGKKAYYNHAGIAIKLGSRLLVVDSNAPGIHLDFLSIRMAEYIDFCVVRINNGFSQLEIDSCLNRVLDRVESSQIKYEFSLLPKIAISRKFGIRLKFNDKENRDICSMFCNQRFLSQCAGIKCMRDTLSKYDYLTPQDTLRYADGELKVLFDDSK